MMLRKSGLKHPKHPMMDRAAYEDDQTRRVVEE